MALTAEVDNTGHVSSIANILAIILNSSSCFYSLFGPERDFLLKLFLKSKVGTSVDSAVMASSVGGLNWTPLKVESKSLVSHLKMALIKCVTTVSE